MELSGVFVLLVFRDKIQKRKWTFDRGQNVRIAEKNGREVVTIQWFKAATAFLLVFSSLLLSHVFLIPLNLGVVSLKLFGSAFSRVVRIDIFMRGSVMGGSLPVPVLGYLLFLTQKRFSFW